jgi:L-gulonolactone oxidase
LVIADEEKSIVHVSSSSKEGWKRDLFNASLCGLGLTGVIIRVGIECEREYKLEEEYFEMDADEFAEGFEEFAVSSEHSRAWWFPQVGKVKCARANRTTKVRFSALE